MPARRLPHLTMQTNAVLCHAERHEAELREYDAPLRAAAGVGRGDRVLDIGCGTGRSTRDAARAAAPGRVLGIDVAEASLERARQLSAAERLDNVTYVHGDAQTQPFDADRFDVALSRFGVMFFSDPRAAFANVASALRPGGRLAVLVWQSLDRNAWATVTQGAIRGPGPRPASPTTGSAFSLADPAAATALLEGAGFRDVDVQDLEASVYFGRDVADAVAFVRGFQDTRETLAGLAPADADRVLTRLHETFAAHYTAERGVAFDSHAWLITATRSSGGRAG